jgi:hypothetical protein
MIAHEGTLAFALRLSWTNNKSSRRFLRTGEEFGNVLSFP